MTNLLRRMAFVVACAAILTASPIEAQEQDIEAWAAERETNFDLLPPDWRLTQPVTLRISFRLKAEPGSAEVDDFLQDLRRTVGGPSSYHNSFKIEPVVVPAEFHYANTMEFGNLARWRAYETSQELRDFVFGRWVKEVEVTQEMVTIKPKD